MGKSRRNHATKSKNPTPPQSSDSEPELENELDIDQPTFTYEPASPAQWSITRRSSIASPGINIAANSLASFYVKHEGPVSRLPPEMLIHIFRQLTDVGDLYSACLVSKAWCECSVELLWLKPHVTHADALSRLLGRLNEETNFSYAKFIRRINLSSVADDLTDDLFMALAACTRLERLTLNGCVHLTDNALSVLAEMHNLVALDLTGVIDVTDVTICLVASAAPKLQGINLEGCKKVTDIGIGAIAHHCSLLRRIKLCDIDGLSSQSISALVKNCPLLIEIDLNACTGITDTAVRDIWKHCFHLRELRLAQCSNIDDLAFPIPPRVAPPPNNPFSNAEDMMSRLTLASLPPLLLSQPLLHLRQLDLMHLSITDEAVAGIVANAPKLRNLVLAKCTMLTDVAVKSIAQLGRHLQFLHLGHATSITDESVAVLAKHCTRLRYVDLACCPALTDESVRVLASLPKLRRIGLVRVVNLTDQAVEYLAARYNTLERVHLSYCERITIGAIHYLLQRLTKLTHLSLTGVPAFRKPELQRWCRPPPSNFNETQRAAFCVYSGTGIQHLRRYLESVAPRLDDLEGDTREQQLIDLTDDEVAVLEDAVYLEDADSTLMPPAPPVHHELLHAIARSQASSGTLRQRTSRSTHNSSPQPGAGEISSSRSRPLAGSLPNPVVGAYIRSRMQRLNVTAHREETQISTSVDPMRRTLQNWVPASVNGSSSSAPAATQSAFSSTPEIGRPLQPPRRNSSRSTNAVTNGVANSESASRLSETGNLISSDQAGRSLPQTANLDPSWTSDSSRDGEENEMAGKDRALGTSSVNGECEEGAAAEKLSNTSNSSPTLPPPIGKPRRGFKGTLSAAEHYATSFFKGKGKAREGSPSPYSRSGDGS